jgi:hypothetical protein
VDRSKLVVGALIALVILGGLAFAFGPSAVNKWKNAHAAKGVATQVEKVERKGAAAAEKKDAKAAKSITVVRAKARQRVADASVSPDPDRVFFDSVCDSGFYEADTRCGSRGGGKKGSGSN